ncbi:MAG: very short patch repair endonuclease [Candidatus Heimdallarchaeota archaeon]|nr:very short patch repair endonuclease [Candidatus Heimdallarchaeota archaeon]
MTDIFTPEQRSKIMSKIKTRDTGIEKALRSALWIRGYRFRIQYNIEGKPDIAFPKQKIAVFCDGCYWHGCPICRKIPVSNKEFWLKKFEDNMKRANEVNRILSENGWIVLRYWGHEIKNDLERIVLDIGSILKSSPKN